MLTVAAAVVFPPPSSARVPEVVLPFVAIDPVFDALGNLYVLAGSTGYKVDPSGAVTVFIDATGDGAGNPLDCSSLACRLTGDAAGNLYVNDDSPTSTVFRITAAGVVSKIIDQTGDGLGNGLDGSWAVPGPTGHAYVSGRLTNNVFHVDAAGAITLVIDANGDGLGNPLTTQPFFGPAVAADGTVYVSGAESDNVFKVESGGTITEIIDASGDGAGNVLNEPHVPHVDAAGNVFVVGDASRNAFKITPGGTITEIIDETGDGAGHALVEPQADFLDALGNFHVASYDESTLEVSLFRIAPDGTITRVLDETGDRSTHPVPFIWDAGVDGAGNVYVGTTPTFDNQEGRSSVLKITPGGGIVPLLDRSGDGAGTEITNVRDIGVAADGTVAVMPSGGVFPEFPSANNVFRVRFGCTPTPKAGCRVSTVPGKSILQVKNLLKDNRDLVKVKWVRGQATTLAAFGDPLASDDYEVCIYDGSATPSTVLLETTAPASGMCAGRPCWQTLGAKGFRYVGRGVGPSGLRKLVLKAGEEGRTKIVASGRGPDLKPMALPLALPVTVQIQAGNGECWEATFSAAGVKKSDEVGFKGLAD